MSARVLHIVTVKPGYEGITVTVLRLVGNMRRIPCDAAFIGEPPEAVRRGLEAAGARVYVVPGRLRRPLRYMRELSRIIKTNGYGIVHAHGNSCTLAIELLAAYLGGARVRAAHSHNTTCKYMLLHRLLRPAFSALYTHGWACGQEAGEWLFGRRGFSISRVSVNASEYAFDARARAAYRAELGLEGCFAVGCVANFNVRKNHKFLLEAFAGAVKKRPEARLLLIGDGELRGELEARINMPDLAGRVLMLGSRGDVPALLSACDGMALTSVSEGFPNALLEWQCAGLSALVSDRVTRDTDLTGLLRFLPVDQGAEEWAEALAGLGECPDRQGASESARRMIAEKGFDSEESARRLEEFYAAHLN